MPTCQVIDLLTIHVFKHSMNLNDELICFHFLPLFQDNVDAGNFTLNWDVDTNVYKKFSDQTDTRYGFTETSDPAVVRAFSQWKMDMVDMPEHCQIVAVEMWHGRRMLQVISVREGFKKKVYHFGV